MTGSAEDLAHWLAGAARESFAYLTTSGRRTGQVIERQIARLSVDISPIRQIATVRTVGSPDYKELFDINGAGFDGSCSRSAQRPPRIRAR